MHCTGLYVLFTGGPGEPLRESRHCIEFIQILFYAEIIIAFSFPRILFFLNSVQGVEMYMHAPLRRWLDAGTQAQYARRMPHVSCRMPHVSSANRRLTPTGCVATHNQMQHAESGSSNGSSKKFAWAAIFFEQSPPEGKSSLPFPDHSQIFGSVLTVLRSIFFRPSTVVFRLRTLYLQRGGGSR